MKSNPLYLILTTVLFISLGLIGYLFYLGYNVSVKNAPLVDAAMEIKLEATTAHLWFEEIVSGDQSLHIGSVWDHIDEADWYAKAMLDGGENKEGTFYPLEDPIARKSIQQVREKLVEFQSIAEQRYKNFNLSMPGSSVDQKFDAVFNSFIRQADDVETKIQRLIDIEQERFFLTGIFILSLSLLNGLFAIYLIYRRDNVQNKLLTKLSEANSNLEKQEQKLENEVTKRTQSLESAKKLLDAQKMAMDEHSIIAITDTKGEIIYVNDKFCEISGYSRGELIGSNHRILNSQMQTKEYWKAMYRTVASGKVWHDEIRNKDKDGNYYWVDTTIVPILDANNKPYNYIAIRTDISQIKSMQNDLKKYSHDLEIKVEERTRQLVKAKEVAESANEAKTRFLANMSHELRTPMHAIVSFTQLVKKRVDDEKSSRFLENIESSAQRLTGLINALLDLSQIESGNMDVSFSRCNLYTITQQCIEHINSLLQDKNLSIEITSDEDIEADFDEKLIAQVIINLLSNAIKYSPEGDSIHIKLISVDALEHANFNGIVEFVVDDNGMGIPKDELDTVFDRFIQSSNSDTKAGGTGLGLPICREIINMHYGTIWLESPVHGREKGTSAHFIIPKIQPETFSDQDISD